MGKPINTANILAKWKSRAGNATEAYKAGVNAVTVSPTQMAAQQIPKYLQGVQNAVNSGRYANSLNAVSLADWQAASVNKGAQNYANGVNNISPKAAKAMADQQMYAQTVSDQIASMPNQTETDMENRAVAAIRLMRQYGKQ